MPYGPPLFRKYQIPRAAFIKRAHAEDASESEVKFTCKRCGWNSGWTEYRTVSEARKGIPCPHCNPIPREILTS